MTKLVGTKILS